MRLGLAYALSMLVTVGCLGPEPQAEDAAGGSTGSTASGPSTSSSAGTSEASAGGEDPLGSSSSTSVASSGGDGGAGATSSTAGSAGGPGTGGDGGSTASTGDGGASTGGGGSGDGGSGGSGGGPLSLGGAVHFLQGGTVTLQNGADTVPITANGSFAFPASLSSGESYDVTVASSPPGQTCWVQNGAGTASADVTDVDVRCTTILQSKTAVGAADVSTTSTSLVAIPNLAPITFTTDVDADVLATLLLPKLMGLDARFHVGLQLDGVVIAEGDYVARDGNAPLPGVVIKLHGVGPGPHTLVPVWSIASSTLVEYSAAYTSEMNLVVLPSLPSFDRAYTATLAANAGSTAIANSQTTPVAMGFAPLSIDVSGAAQPALLSLFAADLAGDNYGARSSLNGQGFAGSVVSVDINVRSFAPIGLTTLAPGNHTVDAEWFKFDTAAGAASRGARGLPSFLAAALFKSGTPSAVGIQEGAMVKPLTSGFEVVHPALQVSVNTSKPSKVLVTFHASNVRPTPNWPAVADVAIFVGGAQGPTFNAFDSNNISWVCQGNSIAGVVDVPTGATTIDVRARNVQGANQLELGNMIIPGATRSILSAVVLD
jgi:hypothetical protein